MYFAQKLSGLMQLFKISNSKLAKGINVDASLVSRWKSGDRKVAKNSSHVPAIANFFLNLKTYHYQKEYLDFVLRDYLSESLLDDESRRVHALSEWLISESPHDISPDNEPVFSPVSTQNILSILASFVSNEERTKKQQAIMPTGDLAATSGNKVFFEVYKGVDGRRQAVLRLMLEAINSTRKLELLLHGEGDMSWLINDMHFALILASLLRQFIDLGHKITIIHVVDRQRNEIINILNHWVPLHLAGEIKSYYYPRYVKTNLKRTLLIAQKHAALVSWNFEDDQENTTYLYHDCDSVNTYSSMFDLHLKECQELFSVYKRSYSLEFLQNSLQMRKKPGYVLNTSNQLNCMLLPSEVFERLLEDNIKADNQSQLISLLCEHRLVFLKKLKKFKYIDILPLSVLTQIESQSQAEMDSSLLCFKETCILKKKLSVLWLKNIISALKKYPNYQLYLSSDPAGKGIFEINTVYQEDSGALFSPIHVQKQSISIMLNEANVLSSLGYFVEDYIQKIPTVQKQKENVILRLEKTLERISG